MLAGAPRFAVALLVCLVPASCTSSGMSNGGGNAVSGAANATAVPVANNAPQIAQATDAPGSETTGIAGTAGSPSSPTGAAGPAPIAPAPATDQIAGAASPFALHCGVAQANGYGCVVVDRASGSKTAAPVQVAQVSVSYGASTASAAPVTNADAASPWSFYVPIVSAHLLQMQGIQATVAVPGQASGQLSAQTLKFDPSLTLGAPSTALAKATTQKFYAFVTRGVFVPGQLFKSRDEASKLCTFLATAPKAATAEPTKRLNLSWYAYLSQVADGSSALSYLLDNAGTAVDGGSGPLIGTDNAQLIASLPSLNSFSGFTGISLDETGQKVTDKGQVWTGTSVQSNAHSLQSGAAFANQSCNDWAGGATTGVTGTAGSSDGGAVDAAYTDCTRALHLYCIGFLPANGDTP